MVIRPLGVGALLALAGGVGCEPNLDQRTFAVTSPRILAVRAVPAEAAPGTKVSFSTLFVDPSGAVAGPYDWAFCDAQNPLANLGPVSPACYATSGSAFAPLGDAATESASIPIDACRLFGPDVPTAMANAPPGRPVDPDPTGGYYQPVRVVAGDDVAIGMVRITCDVPGASPEQLTALTAEDHPNQNPALAALTDPALGTLKLATGGANEVAASERLDLRASWAACDPSAVSCTGSEGYAYLDPVSHAVLQAREEIRVAWFASGGVFDDDVTGRTATDATPYTDNGWTAPASAGIVNLWLVIRDDRGGTGWASYQVRVR